jgi:hypothetical protein
MQTLTEWKRGDKPLAAHFNEPVRALKNILPITGTGGISVTSSGAGTAIRLEQEPWTKQSWLGVIVNKGPAVASGSNGSQTYLPNWTDARYWVKPIAIDDAVDDARGTDTSEFFTEDAICTWQEDQPEKDEQERYLRPYPVTVVNLSEGGGMTDDAGTVKAQPSKGSHTLLTGRIVRVWAEYDAQDPPCLHWVMSETDELYIVKFTGERPLGGYYEGQLGQGTFSPDLNAGYSLNVVYLANSNTGGVSFTGTNKIVIRNWGEMDRGYGALGHAISTNAGVVAMARFVGMTVSNPPVGVYDTYLTRPGALFGVKVEKDGGAQGTSSTPATWTYTVRTLLGEVLGGAVALARPRPNGKMTFQAGSSGYGTAFFDNTALGLWDAGEIPVAGPC